ncbi:hypothetical protein Ctha_1221 [Chloroherpeton thalassium ATCC 35110]|uniref:Capsule assembly protein Wzi n=1 Tax=Chloroherpeton thalassium (strain ATCC 35110 / GB-78) TaxID=517418 RepID=B3QYZ2_CHLT3|nr:capsule assembly Wzi family protein [Chloroherpeton thalassium]ACF13685.1 hypothetical protein Ctha_1221 [Chloroherpeton thalassium ATCC 35110]
MKRLALLKTFLLSAIFFASSIFAPKAFAGGETFPAGHWAYDIIEQLVVRGHLKTLYDAAKPYERLDVARALLDSDKSEITDRQTLWLFIKLEYELDNELNWLRDEVFPTSAMRVGVRLSEIARKEDGVSFSPKFRGRGRLALFFGEDFVIYNSSVVQQNNAYDIVARTRTYGKSTAYTEQAYAAYHGKTFRLKFGRDYINWGYGRNSLAVSNTAGSFDQLMFQINTQTIRFTYFTAMLDRWWDASADTMEIASMADHIDRYYTAERLDFNLFNSNLRFGFWQGVVYGGKNQSIDFRFANPLLLYHGEQYNDEEEINPLGGVDLSVYPYEGVNFYASFLVDDWQFDEEDVNDLEPNNWGGLFGVRAANVLRKFDLYGTDAFFEFTKVTNRTYNQRDAFEYQKLVFGDNPIAHPLGTDFESFECGVSHWLYKDLQLSLNLKMVAKGEGNLDEFDTPWLEDGVTLETGYEEDSPTGIIERTNTLTLGVFYQPGSSVNGELKLARVWVDNVDHVEGKTDTDFRIFMRVMVELQPVFSLF